MKSNNLKSSEASWAYKNSKVTHRIQFKHKLSYLDFVRYMRWYCTDSRSYLYLKLHPRVPLTNGWSDAVYGNWPRHID